MPKRPKKTTLFWPNVEFKRDRVLWLLVKYEEGPLAGFYETRDQAMRARRKHHHAGHRVMGPFPMDMSEDRTGKLFFAFHGDVLQLVQQVLASNYE